MFIVQATGDFAKNFDTALITVIKCFRVQAPEWKMITKLFVSIEISHAQTGAKDDHANMTEEFKGCLQRR
jgi:hypothetical protein